MFSRARLRLTLWYVSMMAATLAAVALGTTVLAAQEVRGVADLELRLRAERLAQEIVRRQGDGGQPAESPRPSPDGSRRHEEEEEEEEEHRERDRDARLAALGILAYAVAPATGRIEPLSPESAAGLPDHQAAAAALRLGAGRYSNLTTTGGEWRVYSLPAGPAQQGMVVQTARSVYLAGETTMRLLGVIGGLGALGLAASGGAGYWLAGRAMRPIETALQRQRDFTADASHELRTPLALVRGNAELLERHAAQTVAENLDLVQDIVAETDRLTRLVAGLLTLARADSGQIQIARAPVNLSALAAGMAREMQPLAADKGLALTGEAAAGVWVPGDQDRLRQLLLILLDNAVRYTQKGSITLRLEAGRREAVLTVEDTGPGIALEHLPHIFERFYRTDTARSMEGGGAGLGLAIAQWIVEAHGGSITAKSEGGRGTAFTVRLPRVDGS